VPSSYRNDKAIAIGSAEYLKEKNPMCVITVRDLEGKDETIVIPPQRAAKVTIRFSRGKSGRRGLGPTPKQVSHPCPGLAVYLAALVGPPMPPPRKLHALKTAANA
jgi:hypothetical protein